VPDVLSDTGKYELHRPTREKPARLSGIVLSHPDLNHEIEGHTDSTGSDELNRRLSEQRAPSAHNYPSITACPQTRSRLRLHEERASTAEFATYVAISSSTTLKPIKLPNLLMPRMWSP